VKATAHLHTSIRKFLKINAFYHLLEFHRHTYLFDLFQEYLGRMTWNLNLLITYINLGYVDHNRKFQQLLHNNVAERMTYLT